MPAALLNNLRAKTLADRRAGLDASAALIRDMQRRADKGLIRFVALYSNIINTSDVLKATRQALSDVKSPIASQYYTGSRNSTFDQSKRMLMAVVWATVASLEKNARFTELVSLDNTCKSNKAGMALMKAQGIDGDGKMFNRATALLWNESEEAMSFVVHQAIPTLWGKSMCANVSVILSDGDPHLITVINSAISNGSFPNAIRKRCFWHAVHQEFTKQFGNAECDSETNGTIRSWLNSLAYRVETSCEFQNSHEALTAWIDSHVDTSFVTRKRGEHVPTTRLERMRVFIGKCVAISKDWAKHERMGLTDLGHITTAISESGFAALKNGNLAVHGQMGIDLTADVMFTQERLSTQRFAVRSDRHVNTLGLPNAHHEAEA